MTIKPPALGPGCEIGIIAPAGPVNQDDLRPGLDTLLDLGLKPVLGFHLFEKEAYLAGDDGSRLEDLHEMIRRENIKAVLCARGGYGSLRLLDRIDYDLIRRNPKIIAGFSDITALLMAIYRKTGLITFHGPLVAELNRDSKKNKRTLIDILLGKSELTVDLGSAVTYFPGTAEGFLMGGNLSLLVHLVGTPYIPSLDNSILFIEDKNESPYRLDRMLTHLHLAGKMKNVRGVMLGKFEGCGTDKELQRVWDNCLAGMDIPMVIGCPFGHGNNSVTLPLGVKARLDTHGMTLEILESPVRKG